MVLLQPLQGHGTEPENELFQLSFEELLDVQVELATKTTETQQSAPSSLTIFTRQQIAQLGVSNAYQLMNYVPGLQSTRGDWVGAVPKAHARGVYLDNGNLLVMINGERLNEVSFGKASVYTPFIPVSVIERVEFIRGPGSALYGSNAFIGVMNIVTRKTSQDWMLGVGENGLVQLAANWYKKVSDELQWRANLAFDKSDGQHYAAAGDAKDPLESVFAEVGLDWQALTLNARYNRVRLDEFINLNGYSPDNRYRGENLTFSGRYTWFQSDTGSLTSSLRYSEHEIKSAGLIFPLGEGRDDDFLNGPYWQTSELNFATEYQHRFADAAVLTSGIELSRNSHDKAGVVTSYYNPQSGVVELDPEYDTGELLALRRYGEFASLEQDLDAYAVYGQIKYPLNTNLTLFAGGRYDDVKDIDSRLSPRLALVYDVRHGETVNTLKLQYGEAFRTPVTNELYSNDDVTRGNPGLKPEVVKTTELVWLHRSAKFQTELVLFHNSLNDFINLVPAGNGLSGFTFANEIDADMRGLEVSINANPVDQLELGFTHTRLFDEPMNASFKRFSSAHLSYDVGDWQANLNAVIRDRVALVADNGEYFEQGGYMVWGGSLSWQLNGHSRLDFKAENLFDKAYLVYDPRVDERGIPGYGRQLSIQYHALF